MQERELHGIAADKSLLALASHEAGHLLMLWLLDRYAIACGIVDGCGITKSLDEPGEKETPHQRILYAMSGMVLAGEFELLGELRQHTSDTGYFYPMSDSHYVVGALPHIDGEPAVVLSQFAVSVRPAHIPACVSRDYIST